MQFKANFYYQEIPTSSSSLKLFLMSLPNIKEQRSENIIKHFGVQGTIDMLDNCPERLIEINGITEKRIPPIKKAWNERRSLRDIYNFLVEHKISVGLADKIFREWGTKSISVLQENPYRLAELYGVGFQTADQVAHKILKDIPVGHRLFACMKYILGECLYSDGNLCLPYKEMKMKVLDLLKDCDETQSKDFPFGVYNAEIPNVVKSNLNMFTCIRLKSDKTDYIYLTSVYEKEVYIADSICQRAQYNNDLSVNDEDLCNAQSDIVKFYGREISLDQSQKDAIVSAFKNKITIITGGGGTGKSTICRAIFSIAQKRGYSIRMMSPTGKAAQVLSEKTGFKASTIHRSLRLVPGTDYGEAIRESIVLVDEVSMSGIDTMYAVFAALEDNRRCNIVFVGDKNQLPSVSPGSFLNDILQSGAVNVVTLDRVHRQDEKSFISLLANEISKGKVVSIPSEANDIKWVNLNPDTLESDLNMFIDKYLISGKKMEDLQIMAPMKKGTCGVHNLNSIIQKKMSELNNTEGKFIVRSFDKFFVGDRVIQIENNYDKDVFNGDMGTVVDLGERVKDASVSDKKEKFLVVDFYGTKLSYYGEEIDQIQLAWAITVHKFQGSQSKEILFIMSSQAECMMTKELIYTAMTRPSKMLTIFGNLSMLQLAPTKSSVRRRYTNLCKFIEERKSGIQLFSVLSASRTSVV